MEAINILKKTRQLTHQAVSELSHEAYLTIPPGFDNNIAWNVGHIIVVQELLSYKLCGVEMAVSEEQVAMFKNGTSPADWQREPDVPHLLEQLLALPQRLEADYRSGVFSKFQPFTTSTGVYLPTLAEALVFINFHEGLHLGFILALKNVVG